MYINKYIINTTYSFKYIHLSIPFLQKVSGNGLTHNYLI